jgi:glycyl-tRNA synthetase beta chain
MNKRADFLVELGTEELPPKALRTLEEAFREGLLARIDAAGLAHGAVHSFSTPRRLAVRVKRLALQAQDQQVQRRGPPVSAAIDASGQPTRAGQAFAQSCGVDFGKLGREKDQKGNECLSFTGVKAGAAARDLLPTLISESLDALPIPKRMRWGAGDAQFVRPVHWLVLLHGAEVIPATVLGATSGNETRGHRFHSSKALRIASPASYEATLEKRGKVVADFATRRARIRAGVEAIATSLGGTALMSDALLDEVTALVEWPVPLAGRFEDRFLALPRELLVSVLQDHQRYFPVVGADGRLLPWFITVSNIESTDPAVVRAGPTRHSSGIRTASRRLQREPRSWMRSPSRRSWVPLATRYGASNTWRAKSPRASMAMRNSRRAQRSWPSATWSPTWSASSLSCRASWAATLRRPMANPRKSARPSTSTTSRAAPVTPCPPRPVAWPCRLPTSSTL